MSARRLLLIDSDDGFFQLLHQQVTPYGFEIYRAAENPDALNQVRDIVPELVFIAVEEPDKLGYSLCNKAKKGVARDIPVILTTATVPPSGFNSHRKLRVHADEYIDKRSMNPDELLNKLDRLIGLGELQVDEAVLDAVDLFEDIGGDDLFDDGGEKTRIAPQHMFLDAGPEEETNAGPDTNALAEIPIEMDSEPDVQTSASPHSSGHVPAPVAAAPSGRRSAASSQKSRPVAASPNIDLGLDQVVEMAVEENSGPQDRRMAQRLQELEKANERLKSELGKAKQSSDSGGHKSFSREREFLNLREVINKKEREILDLRDEVGDKERQILDSKQEIRKLQHAKTALDSKNLELEQRILEQSEAIDGLETDKRNGLDRIGALEGQVRDVEAELQAVNAKAQSDAEAAAAALAGEKQRNADQVAELKQTHADELAEQKSALERDKQAALDAQRGDYENQIAALNTQHTEQLQRQEAAHDEAMTKALDDAHTKHENAMAAAEASHKDNVAELEENHRQALATLGQQHASATQALQGEHADALARAEQDKQTALAELEAKATTALDAAENAHTNAMAEAGATAEERRKSDLAQAADRHAAAQESLRENHERERAELETKHADVVANLEGEKTQLEAGLSAARQQIEQLNGSLDEARGTIAERDQAIEGHLNTITQREDRINALKLDVEELEGQNTGYQEQILKAYQKIKSDEATVNKAKKAVAIALTLLDESISSLDSPSDEAM